MRLFLRCAALVLAGLWAPALMAQAYPTKPIKIVIGYPPGGAVDVVETVLRRSGEGRRELVETRTSDTGQTALHWAAVKGAVAVVVRLYRGGADLRARDSLGASAAVLAVQQGHLETLVLLLHWDAALGTLADSNGCAVLHWAAYKGHAAALYLLAYYAGSSVMGSVSGHAYSAGGWPGLCLMVAVLIAIALAATWSLHPGINGEAGS